MTIFKFIHNTLKVSNPLFVKQMKRPLCVQLNNEDLYKNIDSTIDQHKLQFEKEYLVAKITKRTKNSIRVLQYGVVLPLNIFMGYKFVMSSTMLAPVSTILWAIGLWYFTSLNRTLYNKTQRVIEEVKLVRGKEDNVELQIKVINNTIPMKYDIDKINSFFSTKTETIENKYNVKSFYPIYLDKIFLLPKESKVYDQTILNAILNGKIKDYI